MNKTITVIYHKTVAGKRVFSHQYSCDWEKLHRLYCPKCGTHNVWKDTTGGDEYIGEQHICTACHSTFYLPDGVRPISADNAADQQRLTALKSCP